MRALSNNLCHSVRRRLAFAAAGRTKWSREPEIVIKQRSIASEVICGSHWRPGGIWPIILMKVKRCAVSSVIASISTRITSHFEWSSCSPWYLQTRYSFDVGRRRGIFKLFFLQRSISLLVLCCNLDLYSSPIFSTIFSPYFWFTCDSTISCLLHSRRTFENIPVESSSSATSQVSEPMLFSLRLFFVVSLLQLLLWRTSLYLDANLGWDERPPHHTFCREATQRLRWSTRTNPIGCIDLRILTQLQIVPYRVVVFIGPNGRFGKSPRIGHI